MVYCSKLVLIQVGTVVNAGELIADADKSKLAISFYGMDE